MARSAHAGDLNGRSTFHPGQRGGRAPQKPQRQRRLFDGAHRRRPVLPEREAGRAPLELDEFVAFVNGLGPQTPRRVSKLDVAFEKQLVKKKPS
jgi:hypothetical protein